MAKVIRAHVDNLYNYLYRLVIACENMIDAGDFDAEDRNHFIDLLNDTERQCAKLRERLNAVEIKSPKVQRSAG
jgi:hypothetical protein